jgi:hypothetical protein
MLLSLALSQKPPLKERVRFPSRVLLISSRYFSLTVMLIFFNLFDAFPEIRRLSLIELL